MLQTWLLSGESIAKVRDRVAAPPPEGFGMDVCPTTLYRTQTFLRNCGVSARIADSMDTAWDLLQQDDTEIGPLRETLLVMLYSRAVYGAKEDVAPEVIDKLLSAITKVEKLKNAASNPPARASNRSPGPATTATTRHLVEVSISSPSSPKIIHATATAVPPSSKDSNSEEMSKD